MNFDDHEIWGAPVRATESPVEASTPEPVAASIGETVHSRLYRSAGSEPHPEAIVALAGPRRHTASHPVEATQWASAPSAPPTAPPISINSRIPRAGAIADAALAEIVATPSAPAGNPGFTSWFKHSAPEAAVPALRTGAEDRNSPMSSQFMRAGGQALAVLGNDGISVRTYALSVFAVTSVVGIVNAKLSGMLGLPTGAALLFAATVGAWGLTATARWAAWVLPSYALIAAILVAGQFSDNAPGASPLGQILLVVAQLITLAPWLAAATLLGVAVPIVRGRTGHTTRPLG